MPRLALRLLVVVLVLVALAGATAGGWWWARRDVLPGMLPVRIAEGPIDFHARLDTGATVSSINAEHIEVVNGEGRPTRRDVGRRIRFELVNDRGERMPLEAEIAEIHGIRSADCREVRYHVYLTVAFRGRASRVLMNLNDRGATDEKLLLGRNWLDQGYSVAPGS
ncbi:MAG: ATP-dependent zinc protease [Gammaproteobacteria bacterium]|nr:ATP-dependent zinc protease [Gammaproteobacteria bacterium]MBI5616408.1 ATP-dependent zinc protease [Gammaproteobacteria bacterium]